MPTTVDTVPGGGATGRGQNLVTCKTFLVHYCKNEQRLLFEKSSKNFCLVGARRAAGARGM